MAFQKKEVKNKTLGFQVTEEQSRIITKLAEDNEISVSNLLHRMVTEAFIAKTKFKSF